MKRLRRGVFMVVTFGKTKQFGPNWTKQGEQDNNTSTPPLKSQNPSLLARGL
jgi:hypothetical protein